MATDVAAPFGLFLRPTGKGLATRYGDRRPMGYKGRTEEGRIVIDTEAIVAIPHAEAYRYRREYKRQIAEGCVAKASADDYRAFIAASHKAEEQARKEVAKAARKETGETKGRRKPKPKTD